jgi:nucleoside 2-deoxyribosyltransferase
MKIYISLPISDKDEATQRRHASKIESIIDSQGNEAVNPFDLYDELCEIHKHCRKPKPTYEEIMHEDIGALTDCDAIVLCEGWTMSKGCDMEYHHAKNLGLKIIDEKEL